MDTPHAHITRACYYHSDHLGSAAYLTNDAGQVSQTLNYLPYGEDWVDIQNSLDPRLGQYTFNGKEKDYESGFHYYGARYYWSELLTGWLSVDPMADKCQSINPYAFCMWNPVKLVDPDGEWPKKGVNIYMFKATSGIGLGYGLEAGWKYGIATDQKGMSHFTAASTMYLVNQNMDSYNPALEVGVDFGVSLGFERVHSKNTFYEARNNFSGEFSLAGKSIVGGSIGIGEASFSASLGIGVSLNVSTEQYTIIQSISLSRKEAKEVGYLGIWSVNNITQEIGDDGNVIFTGTVGDSKIQVRCKAIEVGSSVKPDGCWVSDDYISAN